MLVCPLCNGLFQIFPNCPRCGQVMNDTGFVEGYFEPYAPYLDEDILDTVDGVAKNECIHLFICGACGYDQGVIQERLELSDS